VGIAQIKKGPRWIRRGHIFSSRQQWALALAEDRFTTDGDGINVAP